MTGLVLGLAMILNGLAIVALLLQLRRRRPAGICGEPAPLLVPAIARGVCNLPAHHAGWHRADQPGGVAMHWGRR